MDESIANSNLVEVPLLLHILSRISKLEKACNGVVALQFSIRPPNDLGMVIRIYLPQADKEYAYNDVISEGELQYGLATNTRVDVLFDAIHDALEKVQPVSSMFGGLIHKL